LTKEEFQHFGRSAYNRGVATIIWPGIEPNTFNNIPYQHIDFYHGLKLLITQWSLTIPSITNDPFGTYTGRDWSVRYCQYQDPRYYITEIDWATAVWTDSYNSSAKRYISAYEKRHNQLSSNTRNTIPTLLKKYGITLVAHQGSPVKHPANSVAAMRQAAQDWARGVEFDVSRTTDGYHVVVHGPDMWSIQCKNIKKPYIYQYSFKELRDDCTLSNGDAILTLAEMLEKIEWLFDYVFVDIKNYESRKAEDQSKDIVQILSQFDRKDKIHPVSYNKTIANYLLSNSDKISVGWDSYDFDLPDLQQSNIASYLLGIDFLKEDHYITIQNSTIPIFAYTVRSYEQMEKVLDSGITNILVSNINDALSYMKKYYKSH
jgi:glycerophosphoryl diester phosphodiesterase